MRWAKLGHIFVGSGQQVWMATHASNPTADPLGNGWIFKLKIADRSEIDALMDEAAYNTQIGSTT